MKRAGLRRWLVVQRQSTCFSTSTERKSREGETEMLSLCAAILQVGLETLQHLAEHSPAAAAVAAELIFVPKYESGTREKERKI